MTEREELIQLAHRAAAATSPFRSSIEAIVDAFIENKAARATEAVPVLWWDGNDVWDIDECVRKKRSSKHSIPLYTHPAKPESQKASLFWDANDTEMSHENEQELADYAAQDLPIGESMTVDVLSAKQFPMRTMKVWIDSDDDVQWDWIPTNQESGE